ncbi:MAG TPA: ABC transporter ATP-binding protein, partial [Clostridium sp.]|nr:ABC transporter ATP-binding protein [Clostridium sp.]
MEEKGNKKLKADLETAVSKSDLIIDEEKFPNGYETMLSREFDGVDLSGGQWQRISIARGFYREHNMIVLDEPTAAMDPVEETKIYKKFAEMSEGKTSIIVTHRLGSAKIANRIIVMDDGK